jgi:hypothetical protein
VPGAARRLLLALDPPAMMRLSSGKKTKALSFFLHEHLIGLAEKILELMIGTYCAGRAK